MARGNPFKPGHAKVGGRKVGAVNKTTADVREAIATLLRMNVDQYAVWLAQVAEGIKTTVVTTKDGKQIEEEKWLVLPSPAKALDVISALSEYHIPKLARTEHTGEDGGPIHVTVK